MKEKRIFRTVAGIATGLLVVAVVVMFTPSAQTWAARRMLARVKGSSVDRVSIGLGHTSIEGLRIEREGAVLTIPSADADVGILTGAFTGFWRFRSLKAAGWKLDLTRSGEAAAMAGEPGGNPWTERAVGGVVAAFKVPAGFSLDGVGLEGDVIFPDATGRPIGRAHTVVTGGGLAAGRDGSFLCSATASVDDPQAPVTSVGVQATLTMTMAPSGTLVRANLRADAMAVGPQFPKGIGLSCAASGTQDGGKQSFSVALIRGTDRVAEVTGVNEGTSATVSGEWRLDLRDTDLAPFALGRSLPSFYAAGRGAYDFDASTWDIHASGSLQASADRLAVIAVPLGALGKLNMTAEFDMARAGDSLRVSRLNTTIAGDKPVASIRALQSFEFKPSTGELKVAMPSGDLVGISLMALPLSWLRGPFPSVVLTGGSAAGEFVMRAEDGRLVLRTKAPLQAVSVSVARAGTTYASGLDVSAFILADYALQGWQLQLAPFEIRSDGTKILSLEARFGRLAGAGSAVKAAGSWSASIPAFLAMPMASGLPRLTAGDASGNFEASLDSTKSIRLTMALSNLAPPAGMQASMPSVTTEIRADFDASNTVNFSLPLRLDYGKRAPELNISGTVTRDGTVPTVEATLSGTQLTGDDLAVIGALCSASGQEIGDPAIVAPTGNTQHAPWPDLHAHLAVAVDAIAFPRATLHDVRGIMVVDKGSLTIEGGTASLGEGSASKFDGTLSFAPSDPEPYSFKANVSVDNVDSVPFFKSEGSDRPAAIDGKFTVTSSLAGKATTPGRLLGRAQGTLKLTSKDGIIRALHAEVLDSIKQDSSKLADALDTVTALFGKKTDKLGTALVETAKALSEIRYDQMSISAERGEDLDLHVTQITVISPEERLTGTGRITYADGVAIRDQALSVDLELGVRGRITKFMDVVGLLGDTQDDLGYTRLYQPIHLGGTLANIDQTQWKDMLVQAPLRKGGGLFDKLLGR